MIDCFIFQRVFSVILPSFETEIVVMLKKDTATEKKLFSLALIRKKSRVFMEKIYLIIKVSG